MNSNQTEMDAVLGRDIRQSRIYQEAKEEGRKESLLIGKLEVVPLLIEAGFTVDQIAEQLSLEAEVIRRVAAKNE